MEQRMLVVGFLVALLFAVGSSGAPNQSAGVRNGLVSPHIVLGREVDIKDFPYQVSIEAMYQHTCGGAIISENYVLTAAHCLIFAELTSLLMQIRAGSSRWNPVFNWQVKTHYIAEALSHAKYNSTTLDYDVAVIKVSNPFVYGFHVQPIIVAPAGEDNFLDYSRNATISGWGSTSPNGQGVSFLLKSTDVSLVQRSTCAKIWKQDHKFEITSRVLCVTGHGLGESCKGDSGGPLVHRGQVIGVASFGPLKDNGEYDCNNEKYPSGFTNILDPEIRQFIKEKTGM